MSELWFWLAEPVSGTFSRVELLWTALALLGLLFNSYQVWLVSGDLWAALALRRYQPTPIARDRVVAGWWAWCAAIYFEVQMLAFAFVGWVASQLAPAPTPAGREAATAGAMSGLVFVTAELMCIVVIALSLWFRVLLGGRRR